MYAYQDKPPVVAASVGIQWNEPLETPAGTRPDESGSFPPTFRDASAHWAAKGLTAAALANRFNRDTVEHRDVHERTGLQSTLYGSVIGATVYAGAAPGSEDENRLIVQSSDGSTRLMEVNHLRQLGGAGEPPQANHSQTTLWVVPPAVKPQDTKLVFAPTHVRMVQLYSDLFVEAKTKHNETVDQWSFECNPLMGALT